MQAIFILDDKPRKHVASTIEILKNSDIDIRMFTGDSLADAIRIAIMSGILPIDYTPEEYPGYVLTGKAFR